MSLQVVPLTEPDRLWVHGFVQEHWGSDYVVAHGVCYYPQTLPGFVALQNGERVGLLTYHVVDGACEVVTLDSQRPLHGIGSALIHAVHTWVTEQACHRLWLITTNDNLNALRFYQKRGFVLVAVHREAVTQSRQLKPTIPWLGYDGIPIRDEIELEMPLARG